MCVKNVKEILWMCESFERVIIMGKVENGCKVIKLER